MSAPAPPPPTTTTATATTKTPHILIVGAGLGGLALAQGLKKHGASNGTVSFALYERDPSPDTRSQGYRIKIFPDTLPDLEHLLSPELVAEFSATTADTVMLETCVNAVSGEVTARRGLRGPEPRTVDRGFLRKVLLSGLEENIHWGKSFTHYEINDSDGRVTIYFSDGTSTQGDFLVGADGGRSLIRRQHQNQGPEKNKTKIIDPEAVCIYGRTHLTPALQKRIQPALLRGLCVVRDVAPPIQHIIFDNELPISMFVERMHFPGRDITAGSSTGSPTGTTVIPRDQLPDDYMYWSMLAPSKVLGFTEEMVSRLFESSTPKQLAELLTKEWHDSTRCLVDLQDESYAASLRVISCVPGDFDESSRARETGEGGRGEEVVTLMGDAAHVMSPSGGVGAATALRDAVLLTKALVKGAAGQGGNGKSIASDSIAGVGGYEAEMRRVAKVAVERSFRGGKILYGQPDVERCKVLSNV